MDAIWEKFTIKEPHIVGNIRILVILPILKRILGSLETDAIAQMCHLFLYYFQFSPF